MVRQYGSGGAARPVHDMAAAASRSSEPFPTSGGGVEVEGEDGGRQVGDVGGAAAVAA